jgi:hypothetical protein
MKGYEMRIQTIISPNKSQNLLFRCPEESGRLPVGILRTYFSGTVGTIDFFPAVTGKAPYHVITHIVRADGAVKIT